MSVSRPWSKAIRCLSVMLRRPVPQLKNRELSRNRALSAVRPPRAKTIAGRRSRSLDGIRRGPYLPPEIWHEPQGTGHGYKIIVQPAGDGYAHVVTPDEIRDRLEQLPPYLTEPLEVVQLSRMSRKKSFAPCYGMQWGQAIYLYPIEADLVEFFSRQPMPAQLREARMFGGRWTRVGDRCWKLVWTPQAIRDYYLNNVLLHEMGHLLDDRNTTYQDRERFADWFAIRHGYRTSRRELAGRVARRVVRRHHGK
jgi:hypothetical protein